MKKKAIKIAASTAVAASAFVAAAPAQQADAATNVNQLVTDAQNAGTVLKWAISVEGSADYKTQPYAQYNAAKKAIAAAEAAAAKLSASEKLSVTAKLVEPKLQVKRAGAYIDAITSSVKIAELTASLDAAIKSDDIEKVETAYHKATGEYRKQAALLDRVYGQSTRDGIRNEVKPAIEKLVASVKNEVTVNMLAKSAAANSKAGKLEEASQNLTDAQAILDANVLKWETSLQKSVDDVATAMPLQVLSVARVDKNTVTVKFSKTPDALLAAGQFTFDNGLLVQSATIAADQKTVTLKTTDQAAGKTYALSYQGVATGKTFTVAANPADGSTVVDAADTARLETTNTRTYTVSLKNADKANYTGEVGIELKNADGSDYAGTAFISNVDGVGYAAAAVLPKIYAGTDGKVTIVISGGADTSAVYPVFTNLEDTSKTVKGGLTYFYELGATGTVPAGTFGTADYDFVDKTNNYAVLNGIKYNFDSNDTFIIEGKIVTLDVFKTRLSKNDEYYADYQDNKVNSSVWTITDDVDANADIEITTPSKAISYDGTTYRLTGEGEAGAKVFIYKETDTGLDISTAVSDTSDLATADDVLVGDAVVSSNGTWVVQASNLTQDEINKLYAVQVGKGQKVDDVITAGGFDHAYLKVGAFTASTITWNDNATAGLSIGDTLTFDFLNNPLFAHDFKNGKGTIVVNDGFGRTATLSVEHTSNSLAGELEITKIAPSANFNFQTDATAASKYFNIESVSGVVNTDDVKYKLTTIDSKVFVKN
ncbi:hypothetical protein AM499_12185 [Bacillus sp. FJAT-22090]|uniref:hypothetical protein n=1 Tax=Bacillus sp. FJAT-22090 TaxID=1581038 RepID=UPI0006B06A58|nr:hypothetical protein [Bacillus sp. FJAT-22090]ALC86499.1 hypothetical protein AM499_12185 [Bacillus sp. FJAT-22090]